MSHRTWGFGGIANIDGIYTATHVDVRTSNYWKSDETVTTTYSVISDFYVYYKLSKSDVYPSTMTTAKKTAEVSVTVNGNTYSGTLTEK